MIRRALLAIVFVSVASAGHAQTCPQQTAPQFPNPAGSVFGAIASMWQQYFRAKVDANNGTVCNLTILGTLNLTYSQVVAALGFTPMAASQINGGTPDGSIASASTTDLGSSLISNVTVTGSVGITSFGSTAPAGTIKIVYFTGTPTITYNATSMIITPAASYTPVVNSFIVAKALGSGNWAIVPAVAVVVNGVTCVLGNSCTVTAAAGTLTGATLAAGVTASSLTSVGTLTGGATGAGFTVALSTSTITGTLDNARLNTRATWTVTDQSGAGLSISSVDAKQNQIANIVHAYAQITYPVTADGTAAKINLPIAVAAGNGSNAPSVVLPSSGSTPICLKPLTGTLTAALVNCQSGAALTNANLSTLTLNFMSLYPAS